MYSNTISEIIKTLGELNIEDANLSWQLKQLMDKLCLLEEFYDELSRQQLGANSQENDRYINEVFPSILLQCRKLARYYTVCPELRRTEQDINVLKIYFQRYNKIIDRYLVRLQKEQSPTRLPFWGHIKQWMLNFSRNVGELYRMASRRLKCIFCNFHFNLPRAIFRRKTLVIYHRDAVDCIGKGYKLQPIRTLPLNDYA